MHTRLSSVWENKVQGTDKNLFVNDLLIRLMETWEGVTFNVTDGLLNKLINV